MLTEYPRSDAAAGNKPIWIDLCNPDPAEFTQAEAESGMCLPSRDSLSEIESSSRLRERDGVLSVSIPMFAHRDGGPPHPSPVGFVLSRDCLVTLRYERLPAFDAVAQDLEALPQPTALAIFVCLGEEIVDRLADSLEQAAADLRKLSANTFHDRDSNSREAIRSNRQIRAKLRHVGRLADGIAETRDVLLGVGRAVGFVAERVRAWDDHALESRLASIQRDVTSLAEYEVHLSDKVQFLLDAMVGLIGIAQNEVFRVLTIVSIIGIPPTLLAGVYGMNFKYMPEYNWAYGYPYGLTVIALSGLLPLAWFKWRGWF
jgi:magnesium transporter